MTNLSFHLFQLQKTDLRLDQIVMRINKINDLIEHNQALQEADVLVKKAESDVALKNAEITELENAARLKSIKIEQSEASLYKGGNQNPKELADLQKEVASLKRIPSTIEEDQLSRLTELEDLSSTLLEKKALYSSIYEDWQNANQSLMVELENLNKENEKVNAERLVVTGQIPAEQLSLYEKLRISKNRIAVTSVEEESCTICGSEISAANIQKAKSSTLLTTCPSCGRILYTG